MIWLELTLSSHRVLFEGPFATIAYCMQEAEPMKALMATALLSAFARETNSGRKTHASRL